MEHNIIKCPANWKHVTLFQFKFRAEKARDSVLISLREVLGIELWQSFPGDPNGLRTTALKRWM